MEPYDNNALMYKIALMVHFKTSLLVLKLLYRTAFSLELFLFPCTSTHCYYNAHKASIYEESDANTVMKHTLSNLCFSSVYQCLKKQFSIIHNTVVFCKTHSTCA